MTAMEHWSAAQYLKFEQQRTRPAIDLTARISLEHPQKIVEISCGTGAGYAVLQQRYPDAYILCVDSSAEMLREARKRCPDLTFRQCDAQKELSELGDGYDIVFSNVSLQWIPDHPAMIRSLLGMLQPHGVLAVQIPMNYGESIHKIILRLVESPRWKDNFLRPRPVYHLTGSTYYDLLSEEATDFHLWQTTYYHHMPSHEAIVEWYCGAGLRPYLEAFHPEKREGFVQAVLHEVKGAYPTQKDGTVIFRFPRLFFVAEK